MRDMCELDIDTPYLHIKVHICYLEYKPRYIDLLNWNPIEPIEDGS